MSDIVSNPTIALTVDIGAPKLFYFADGRAIFGCIGSPNGVIVAKAGSIALDITPVTGTIWFKTTDTAATGWVSFTAGSSGFINPTDGVIPVRFDATTFNDSQWLVRNASTTDLRNINAGATAQVLRLYRLSDDGITTPVNFERLTIDSSSVYRIRQERAGTGSIRSINIGAGEGGLLSWESIGLNATVASLLANVCVQIGHNGVTPTDDIGLYFEGVGGQTAAFIACNSPDLGGIVFAVNDNGEIETGRPAGANGAIIFYNDSDSNTTAIRAPENPTDSWTLILPDDDPVAGQALVVDSILTSPNRAILEWDAPGSAIGAGLASGTVGSVLFVAGGPVIAQDNANLFWDDTNNRFGIGTNSPDRALEVSANIGSSGVPIKIVSTSSSGIAGIECFRSNDTDRNSVFGYSNESAEFGSATVIWSPNSHNILFIVGANFTTEIMRCTSSSLRPGGDGTIDLGDTTNQWRQLFIDQTITAGGTTGNQTINKSAGTVNAAAASTAITVTCNKCTTSSLVFAEIRSNDATGRITSVVPGTGSFVINYVAPTAEMSIGFHVVNQ